MSEYPASREAYIRWREVPSQESREALRRVIISEGGHIVGHGVIAWARANLTALSHSQDKG